MTTYESEIKTIFSSEEVAFELLSDLNNLEKFKNLPDAPKELQELEFDRDSCRFKGEGLFSDFGFRIVERIPNSTIKLEAENIPMMSFRAVILLNRVSEYETNMKLKLGADMPMMVKMMIESKIKDGINKVADAIVKAINKSAN